VPETRSRQMNWEFMGTGNFCRHRHRGDPNAGPGRKSHRVRRAVVGTVPLPEPLSYSPIRSAVPPAWHNTWGADGEHAAPLDRAKPR
jgi:hypothetical protein